MFRCWYLENLVQSEVALTPYCASQACLKEIHANMLRKHLERLETPSDGENIKVEPAQELEEPEESDHEMEGMNIVFVY